MCTVVLSQTFGEAPIFLSTVGKFTLECARGVVCVGLQEEDSVLTAFSFEAYLHQKGSHQKSVQVGTSSRFWRAFHESDF